MKKVISTATCPVCSGSRNELHVYIHGTRLWSCYDCGELFDDNQGTVGAKRPPTPRQVAKVVSEAQAHPSLMAFKTFYNQQGIDSAYAAAQVKRMVEGGYLEMDADLNLAPTPEGSKIAAQEFQRPRAKCPVCGKEAILLDLPLSGKVWACEDHMHIPDNGGVPAAPFKCKVCGKKAAFHFADHGAILCAECGAGEKFSGHKCPVCRGTVGWLSSEETGAFWKCHTCNANFADDNGRPATTKVCKSCSKKSLTRFEAQKAPGTFFWACGACKSAYTDKNGEVGVNLG